MACGPRHTRTRRRWVSVVQSYVTCHSLADTRQRREPDGRNGSLRSGARWGRSASRERGELREAGRYLNPDHHNKEGSRLFYRMQARRGSYPASRERASIQSPRRGGGSIGDGPGPRYPSRQEPLRQDGASRGDPSLSGAFGTHFPHARYKHSSRRWCATLVKSQASCTGPEARFTWYVHHPLPAPYTAQVLSIH